MTRNLHQPSNMAQRFLLPALIAAIVMLAAAYAALRVKYPPVDGWTVATSPDPAFDTLDPWIKETFLDTSYPAADRYADVFRYLIAGFLAYRSADSARAYYPGFASSHGRDIDGLEGFSRIAPLIAAWIAGGRRETVQIPSFGDVDLLALLRSAIQNGTDPASNGYWGDIHMLDQRLVEAADIALMVWLTRNVLWATLAPDTRRRLVVWLAQAEGKADSGRFSNWRLFPMMINRTLKSLGEPVSDEAFASDWSSITSSYAGNGWFRDSSDTRFDYYNAWSFHYSLFWLTQIDQTLDTEFVAEARNRFVSFYQHLVTAQGFPILGRSVCYRTAMPVPLLIAAVTDSPIISAGEARRALELTWRYFISRDALTDGVLTQGYCGPDLRTLDTYSGPASCLWGARSLVVALSQPDHAPFWSVEEMPLPIEQADFSISDETLHWRVEGNREQGTVAIHQLDRATNPPMQPYSLKYKLASGLFHRPFSPGNRHAKYDRSLYSSADPFCGCIYQDQ